MTHLVAEALSGVVGVPHEVPSQAGPPLGVRRHRPIHVADRPDDARVQLLLRQVQPRQIRCKCRMPNAKPKQLAPQHAGEGGDVSVSEGRGGEGGWPDFL